SRRPARRLAAAPADARTARRGASTAAAATAGSTVCRQRVDEVDELSEAGVRGSVERQDQSRQLRKLPELLRSGARRLVERALEDVVEVALDRHEIGVGERPMQAKDEIVDDDPRGVKDSVEPRELAHGVLDRVDDPVEGQIVPLDEPLLDE